MSEAVAQVEPVEEPEAAISIADHKAQFGVEAQAAPVEDDEPRQPHHASQQRRDRDRGTFAGGMKPGPKPKFDQAEVDAATKRLKDAEEKYFAEIPKNENESDRAYRIRVRAELIERHSKPNPRVQQLETELARLRTQGASPAKVEQAAQKVEAAGGDASDPEPNEDDPKFGGDYSKFLIAQARWASRDERRQERTREREHQTQAQREQQSRATLDSFRSRVDDAKKKYKDFDAVAFAPTRIPADSAIDVFIMDDDAGPDVLYHLQSHREELDELLAMPVLKQVKHLALLSQRLSSASSGSAGTTGSAPERTFTKPLPKPPNPVRTEAQRASDAPPPTDGSLSSIDAHRRHFQKKR